MGYDTNNTQHGGKLGTLETTLFLEPAMLFATNMSKEAIKPRALYVAQLTHVDEFTLQVHLHPVGLSATVLELLLL